MPVGFSLLSVPLSLERLAMLPPPPDKQLYTMHLMQLAELEILTSLVVSWIAKAEGVDAAEMRERLRVLSRAKFMEMTDLSAVTADSPIPAWELQEIAKSFWADQ